MNFLLPQCSPGADTGTCHPQGGENLHQGSISLPPIPWLWIPPSCSGLPVSTSLSPQLHTELKQSSNRARTRGFEFPFARCRDTDVHTVASLFKLYLRELPEPVVPWLQYEDFLLCGQALEADETKVEVLLFSSSWP